MTFELPGSVWVLLVSWLLASVCVAAALARWFRYLR